MSGDEAGELSASGNPGAAHWQITALLDGAGPVGAGIGGTTASLSVDGIAVFVKKVPLTDVERRPEHRVHR